MVLIELRVKGVDLPLAVGVVERVVDGVGRNAQPRRRHPINRKVQSACVGLLVGGDILNFLQPLQLADELVGPLVQLVAIGILQRVLVLGAADAVIHRDVLHRLHVEL